MPRVTCLGLLAAIALLIGASAAHARLAANRLSANRLSANRLPANRLAANRLAANKLAAKKLAPKTFAANPEGVAELTATAEGREVLSFIVSCALPFGVTLQAPGTGGTVYEFFGEFGLARSWISRALSKAGRGWVSACLFARVNDHNVALPISLRGPHRGLATTTDEASTYTLEEGAFYGDYFVPEGEPIRWVACRGASQAAGETGGLLERDCAEPDAADPTRTQCAFEYAGDCGDFAPEPACRRFSRRGFYRNCHDEPMSTEFPQVITVFALP